MKSISSRDNPQLKIWRRLAQDSTAYRKAGQFWLEGDHLCRAALERGVRPLQVVLTESFQAVQGDQWAGLTDQVFVVPDALFASLSGLESPARMGFVVAWTGEQQVLPDAATVVLDRLQDAGNVGAILRCASAFGYRQVLAIKGTAALWSPKVLRAGMGAHFGLQLVESVHEADRGSFASPRFDHQLARRPFFARIAAPGRVACPMRLGVWTRRAGRERFPGVHGPASGAHRPARRRRVFERGHRCCHLFARQRDRQAVRIQG